jgi:chromatin remodeling complex protein RSC6
VTTDVARRRRSSIAQNKKKVIHCDEKLKAVIGSDSTDAFKMNKPLQKCEHPSSGWELTDDPARRHFYPLD